MWNILKSIASEVHSLVHDVVAHPVAAVLQFMNIPVLSQIGKALHDATHPEGK